jgi:hypothetical protein
VRGVQTEANARGAREPKQRLKDQRQRAKSKTNTNTNTKTKTKTKTSKENLNYEIRRERAISITPR